MIHFSTPSFFKINPDEPFGLKAFFLMGTTSIVLHLAVFYIFQYENYTQMVIHYQEFNRPFYTNVELSKKVLEFSTLRVGEIIFVKSGFIALTMLFLLIFRWFFSGWEENNQVSIKQNDNE